MSLKPEEIGRALVRKMPQITLDRIGSSAFHNAEKNLQYLDCGKSLKELRGLVLKEDPRALVIAAGPSLHRIQAADLIQSSGHTGTVIATDSAMYYCLKNGIVPDLVVSLDPHATRIARWFGVPGLKASDLVKDDYFVRQDMDPDFSNELKVNEEVLELLERDGKKIRIALSTSASEAVVQRAIESGMKIYWWNPMLDDPSLPDGVTRQLYKLNNLPCVNAGGNVGSACWMMAGSVLNIRHIAVTGMDFGYYENTPYKNTQYYYEAVELVGEENLDSIYIKVYNPHLQEWFYTDPAYMWYRNCFLEMVAEAGCVTYNCTEGGILFGDHIQCIPLGDFLNGSGLIDRP